MLNLGGQARTWRIPSIFGRSSAGESQAVSSLGEPSSSEAIPSPIHLREPPDMLRPVEITDNEATKIIITKLLLQAYYGIVRKNIRDLVPKAIMHFLVNLTKRNLPQTLICNLYRENQFDALLQEQDALAVKQKRNHEWFRVLEQCVQTLGNVEFDVSSQTSGTDASIGLPRIPRSLGHQHPTACGELGQYAHCLVPTASMTKSSA